MNAFVFYQFKVALCMAVLTGLYYLILRKETFYGMNRIYLLVAAGLSFLLPALHIDLVQQNEQGIMPILIRSVTIVAGRVGEPGPHSNPIGAGMFIVYILVSLIFLFRLIAQLNNLVIQSSRAKILSWDENRIIYLTQKKYSFSFFHLIFIQESDLAGEQYSTVLNHETAHARQFHSADRLFFRLIKIFQWFNPFFFLMERALQETHEYQADRSAMEQDGQGDRYRLLLLSRVFGVHPGILSFFNHSRIKNRIAMMTKPKSPPASRWKYLSALPLLLLLFFVMSCRTGNKQAVGFPPPPPPPPPPAAADTLQEDTALLSHEKSFIIVDQQASFQGGDIQTFREWVQKNLKYPEIAIKAGEYGKVIVQFSVSSTGKVIQVKVLRTVTPSLAKAAVEAIQSSPPWIPAKVKGQNVAQQFVMPVVFALK